MIHRVFKRLRPYQCNVPSVARVPTCRARTGACTPPTPSSPARCGTPTSCCGRGPGGAPVQVDKGVLDHTRAMLHTWAPRAQL
eukprot:CAMPEP_0197589300 /NCGR_PEP_ID=MMETSP1326-20131121/10296_1 /TAXON_ID=1155430 /ORGANISM="Genus nov. species nov., Strain RCC2288" /LENGTH=82 /DNA_ID=CAMNT_0043154219 /DNA_START=109 /DNA_END=353 /DNA_ORIENTATION=+